MAIELGQKMTPLEVRLQGIGPNVVLRVDNWSSGIATIEIDGHSALVSISQLHAACELAMCKWGALTPPLKYEPNRSTS